MTTPYWSDFVPNSTFYRILSGFHRTFATGVACRQGTLTPPDTWSRPFGTCICSTCWDQSFTELVVILPDYALRISLGTFSILLAILSGNTWNTWSCPTLGLGCVLMSRPISPELVLSPDFWISNTPRYFSFASTLFCTMAISVPHHPDKKCNFTWFICVHTQWYAVNYM